MDVVLDVHVYVDVCVCVCVCVECAVNRQVCFMKQINDCSDDKDGKQSSIDIIHTLATPLPSVGLQVWRASFLLCDYLLHHTVQTFPLCVPVLFDVYLSFLCMAACMFCMCVRVFVSVGVVSSSLPLFLLSSNVLC